MMGRTSTDAYEYALGLREVETYISDVFEAEFSIVTGRTVEILLSAGTGESPDRVALIDGVETGVELTAIHGGSAHEIIAEVLRIAHRKRESYSRRGIFETRPIILLGHLDWPARDVEGPALYDVYEELAKLFDPDDFGDGFSEIWLMDCSSKYTSRRDPRMPADFFCFAPTENIGFWEGGDGGRKRRPYWGLIRDFLT